MVPILYKGLILLWSLEIDRRWHLFIFNCICHLVVHWESESISLCNILESSSEEIIRYKMQSSAKRRMLDFIPHSMSFINNKNSNGPRTVPCGTPEITSSQEDWQPSTTTRCFLFQIKEEIQRLVVPVIPYDLSFSNNFWWGTESNALLKSKTSTSVRWPESRDAHQSLIESTNWVSHEKPDLKPCWFGTSILLYGRKPLMLD